MCRHMRFQVVKELFLSAALWWPGDIVEQQRC